jgi:hypothetical protein
MHCYTSPNHIGPAVAPPASVGYQPNINPHVRVASSFSGPNNAIDNYMKPRTTCLNAAELASFETCAQRRKVAVTQSLQKLKNDSLTEAQTNPVYGLNSLKTSFIFLSCVSSHSLREFTTQIYSRKETTTILGHSRMTSRRRSKKTWSLLY